VGPPNVGKSTLLNALLGTKLSIVTPRAQTTWRRVTGIDTRDEVQMVFLDTPGLLEVRDLLQRSMLEEAHQALRDADVVLLVLDATRPPDEGRTAAVLDALALTRAPRVVAVNKVDQALQEDVGSLLARAATQLDAPAIPISALHGTGLEPLRTALAERLPLSPFLYPRDDIASQPVRFFAAELIRETVFERYRQEIPYAAFCVVEEFREEQRPVYIGATLYVERASQKGILVGVGGAAIRDLGRAARQKIETFLGEPVYLDLWVKALPGWRRKRGHLARFGFRVPEDHERSR
jgi:GTP-binding protein Era